MCRIGFHYMGAFYGSSTTVFCLFFVFVFFATMRGKMILKGCNSSATPAKHPWCLAALDPYKRH